MMPYNTSYCKEIQTTIAVGLPLDEKQRQHSQTCVHCRKTLETLAQLDKRVMEMPLPAVPNGFATRVMQSLDAQASKTKKRPSTRLALPTFWTDDWVQIILGLLGLLFTSGSLVRFIFGVWLATAVAN
jgi:hypothetical protein